MPRPDAARAAVKHPRLKLVLFVLLCLLPVGGACLVWARGGSPLALLAYGVMSLLTFGLYWHDKRRARESGQRTPEKLLHATELLGGWPGALLAQQAFRHKTRKVSYLVALWGIVLVHELGWVEVVIFGGRHLA
ncbi:MAG: DUF1294 domain-containing protein [Pseudomonas sp.]|uniref:DUF1294 domain-containing protein n=1 Tax=Pseudomonas abieticivorans TaxID=2931382 RepID=UPI0020C0A204|nr:DUF1294 domain-containing protein [Pseudomonas sp. PIA16]MDE1166552.1 DUF1294 domain-containing protein [Pseudomonas sp.]